MERNKCTVFGNVIQAQRRKQGLTVEDVAHACGCSARAVYGWQRGAFLPGLLHFARLCQVLELEEIPLLRMVQAVENLRVR